MVIEKEEGKNVLAQGWPNFLDRGPFSEIGLRRRPHHITRFFIFFAFSLNFWVVIP